MQKKWDESEHPRAPDGKFMSGLNLTPNTDNIPLMKKTAGIMDGKGENDGVDNYHTSMKEQGNQKPSESNLGALPKMNASKPQEFQKTLSETKDTISPDRKWRVDIHDVEHYKSCKLFTSEHGSCVAVESDGNIISVCRYKDDTVRGSQLLDYAKANGGDRLDAFGEDLYAFYTKNGFTPISWTPFDKQYAPDGWVDGRDKPEPVIFYALLDKPCKMSYNEFIESVTAHASYDEAKAQRDKEKRK